MTNRIIACVITLLFLIPACSSKQLGSTDDHSPQTGSQPRAADSTSYYYDFDDILVPRAMELEPKQSFVFEGPSVKAGVLVFKGRVDAVSLTNFFINNMVKDGWQLSSSFKYRRTILVFNKPDRDCIINILDERLSTYLEIWIAPKEVGSRAPAPPLSERSLTQ